MQHPDCTLPATDCRITTAVSATTLAWTPVYDGSGTAINTDPNVDITTYTCATCARVWQITGTDAATLVNLEAVGAAPIVVDAPYVGVQDQAQPDLLSCTMGNWAGTVTRYGWEWIRDGNTVVVGSGERGDEYLKTDADVGHTLSCTVIAANGFGETRSMSNAFLVPPPATNDPQGVVPEAHERSRNEHGQFTREPEVAPPA
jgi:hypothetical protein